MPGSTQLHDGIRTLRTWMKQGSSPATVNEWRALGGLSEFHAAASGFLKDAHQNLERSVKICDMVNNLPVEIRNILPDQLKLEVCKQMALSEAWMRHAESFIYEEPRVDSDPGPTPIDASKVKSLVDRAASRPGKRKDVLGSNVSVLPFIKP